MQRKSLRVFSLLLVTVFLLTLSVGAALTAEESDTAADGRPQKLDDRMDPLTMAQRDLHSKAMEAKLYGKAQGRSYEAARGKFVELKREDEDAVWTVLGEFSDYPHNSIPEPDRAVDNSTLWEPDFSHGQSSLDS